MRLIRPLLLCSLALAVSASSTHVWTQGEYSDFDRAVIRHLSLRSDGLVTLAPRSHEVYDTGSIYLWALARDSKGNLYAGGGTGAKVYLIPPDGKAKMLAELDALEVHAIAIDSRDRVYAATSPDGKVYRIAPNGKSEVFYDPKAKYIWGLAFDSNGDLYVATGDQGEIHRVPPDGKGKVFFQTEETHVRSLTIDPAGNLIAGTEPRGLVLRVSPSGEGFVLYQMPKREVTAVAVAPDGSIYAAAVGTKAAASSPAAPPLPTPAPATVTVNAAPGAAGQAARSPAPPPASVGTSGVPGGSDVFRIDPTGYPRRVWSHSADVVYAIAFDASGKPLLGAGNKGSLYRIESPSLFTALLSAPATQITAFCAGRDGRLYAATGNPGKVYEIGPELESEGSLESDVFDANLYTLWGRLSFEANLNGGRIALTTRSGNLDQPQKNWSPWSAPLTSTEGGRIVSPASRFVQWKATLNAAPGGHSPELESVDVAYLPKNIEPHVDGIETTPANHRFPGSLGGLGGVATLNLPPMGGRAISTVPVVSAENAITATPAMLAAKGFVGARWLAGDPNGDTLSFNLEIRGVKETEWKPLKAKIPERYYSWDSTAFPDGEYRLRVTASDAPSNPPAEALSSHSESAPFLIDNTPPKISGLAATRAAGKIQVKWHAADALNVIDKAEYSLDGGDWTVAAPVTHLSDSKELDYTLDIDAGPGEHTIALRVQDASENIVTDKVVVQ